MNREDSVIAWLRRRQSGGGLGLPGDDAAVLGSGASARALTADQQIAGVHVPADLDPTVWARRLLAVNLSDLAAMGAAPEAALLTLAVPDGYPVRRFLGAAVAACRKAGIPLVGGDLASSPTMVTTMTLVGRRQRRGRWVDRSAAASGDALWVGGTLGLSAVGQRWVARGARLSANRVTLPPEPTLPPMQQTAVRHAVRRHLAPNPQLALGGWLARRRRAAAIDLSDGLALDLARLMRESRVGAVIDAEALPIAPEVFELAPSLGQQALHLALGGGEDYVLLFTLPPRVRVPAEFGAIRIGRVTENAGIRLEYESALRPLEPAGWDHLTAL